MKNKMKKLLAVFVAILTFVTIAVVDVRAAEFSLVLFDSNDASAQTIIDNKKNEVTIDGTNSVVLELGSTITFVQDKGLLKGMNLSSGSNTGTRMVKITVAAGYDITSLKVSCDAKTNVRTMTFSSDGTNTSAVGFKTNSTVKSTTTELEFVENTISQTGDALSYYLYTSGSVGIYKITINLSNDNSSLTTEELAVLAIDKIGVVEYTNECYALINNAKSAVENCTNPSELSNYQTYLDAVKAFEALQTEKTSEFINAVDSIGTITSDSKDSIDAAYLLYDGLITADKENETIITNKTKLDELNKEFTLAFGVKSTSINFGKTDETLRGNVKYTVETSLYTATGNSIFLGSINASIEDSGKEYNGVAYPARFKTNGTIQVNGNGVAGALIVDAPSRGAVKLIGVSGNSTSTRNIKVCKLVDGQLQVVKDYGNIVLGSGLSEYEVVIPSAGKYYIGSDTVLETDKVAGGINFYYAEFTPTTATFEAQYNNSVTADSTKLRFIGTIAGVSDTKNIASIQFKFTFSGTDRTGNVTSLYTSITSGGTVIKAAADNTYYVVYTLNNINKADYKGLVLSNLELVITFTDGSTVTAVHDNITLPQFTTVQ